MCNCGVVLWHTRINTLAITRNYNQSSSALAAVLGSILGLMKFPDVMTEAGIAFE